LGGAKRSILAGSMVGAVKIGFAEERKVRYARISPALLMGLGLLIAFASCGKKKPPEAGGEDDLLARVGDRTITVREFVGRIRYAPVGRGAQSLDLASRKSYLDVLVEEKLAALAARAKGLDKEVDLEPTLEEVRDQAMLRELYLDRVRNQVVLPEKEIEIAVKRATEELDLAYFRAASEEEAWWVRQRILEGRSFSQVAEERYGRRFSEDQFRRRIRWGEAEPALEEVAYMLNVGEVSEPVPVEGGYYILKLLGRRQTGISPTNEFRSAVEQRLRYRKEARLAREFAERTLRANPVAVNREALDRLAEVMQNSLREETFPTEIDPSWLMSVGEEFAWRDSVLLEVGTEQFRARDVLTRLARGGRVLRLDSLRAIPNVLAGMVLQLAQDEALLQEARRLGLEDHPRVRRDVAVWEDYLLAQILRDRLGEESRFRAVVDSVRAKLTVTVFETKLASLDLSAARQTSSAAWASRSSALPPWPGE